MRLIATLGSGGIRNKHSYSINGKCYERELSFMALAKAYEIKDIVIIGTKDTQESIELLLKNNLNIKMVVIESDKVEDVFQKSLEYISKDTILDLTQGYRHYPMLTLLASVFLQNSLEKNVKDIFYAQVLNEDCNSYHDSCEYQFVSLIKYLDIANMVRIINTFQGTLLTLDYTVHDDEFKKLKDGLHALTKELFSNNFEKSKSEAESLENVLNSILEDKNLQIIEEHLMNLKDELALIQELAKGTESEVLLNVSEYFLKKGILLHSITLLYESMVAFLDERVTNKKCDKYINKKGEMVLATTFKRRNCLKLKMGDCNYFAYKNNIPKCKEFSSLLRKVDSFRNLAAHGHTTGTYHENLENELKKAITTLKLIISS